MNSQKTPGLRSSGGWFVAVMEKDDCVTKRLGCLYMVIYFIKLNGTYGCTIPPGKKGAT